MFEAILDSVDFDRDGYVRLEEYMQVCLFVCLSDARTQSLAVS